MVKPLNGAVSVKGWTDDRTSFLAVRITGDHKVRTVGEGPQGYWQFVKLSGSGRSVNRWVIPIDPAEGGPLESEDLNHLRVFYPNVYEWAFALMQEHMTASSTPRQKKGSQRETAKEAKAEA